jgi:hypothetical protein
MDKTSRLVLLTLSFLYVSITNGQSIYIRPLFESKISINKKNPANQLQASPLYRFDEIAWQQNDRLLPNSFGITLGVKFKKYPIGIESGFFNTTTQSGYRVLLNEYGHANSTLSIGGIIVLLIPLEVFYWPENEWHKHLSSRGVSLSYSFAAYYHIVPSIPVDASFGQSIKLNDSTTLNINDILLDESKPIRLYDHLMFSMGMNAHILNKKKKEVLNLGIRLYYGNANKSYELAEIFINNSKPVRYYARSSGNGIGISISRNFNFIKFK